jgi:hypothetical protein
MKHRWEELAAAPLIFITLILRWLKAKIKGEKYEPPDFG